MKSIQIKNSYDVWNTKTMNVLIKANCYVQAGNIDVEELLNRSFKSMYIEWYLHNIGYYLALPFLKNAKLKSYNIRCKDVDLEEHF